ncbi:MAG: hypothetical protein V7745_03280 [Pseudomonadales bacterium]
MARQQHRFSRQFLTILIVVCSIAIILLSQSEQSEDSMLPPSSTSPQLSQP